MNNFGNTHSLQDSENSNRQSEVPSTFKRKYVNNWTLSCPRRYVLALMLFILVVIQTWMSTNIGYILAHIIIFDDEAANIKYSSIGDWTVKELYNLNTGSTVAHMLAQMPAALLIFIFSSHKFLMISVTATSVLHMLTPVALSHHSISVLIVLISQSVVGAPINIAVLAIWKDWAPPAERTKLILFSMSAIFIGVAASTFYSYVFPYLITDASFVLSGIAGIIWVLFWYNITSDTPQNDPSITEEELIYIESNLPSDHLQKTQVKDIPWKSILLSRPVIVLVLIFIKVGCSLGIILVSGTLFHYHLGQIYNPLYIFIPFITSFVILILSTAVIADWLIKKFHGRILFIRKCFLCGGFFLQCVFLFGTLADSELTKTIFFMIGYSMFAMSIPGFITIPMDLSPRYVSIISGIIVTFWSLATMCNVYFIDATINFLHLGSLSWVFLLDGVFTILSAISFVIWGDVEEQPWSLTIQRNRRANDYRSYPKPEDQDNLNLVV